MGENKGRMRRAVLSIILLMGLLLPVFADNDVFTGQLDNSWQNWSWATVNLSNTSPLYSGADSIAVTAGAYQALYFHKSGLTPNHYSLLRFWMNGGTSGGQVLQVSSTINGTQQSAYPLPALKANSWTEVTIPLSALLVTTGFDGLEIQNPANSILPVFYVAQVSLITTPPPSVVALSVNCKNVIATIDPKMFGVNTAVWDSLLATPTTGSAIANAGVTFLRFPGGSTSDGYHWATNTTDSNTWTEPTNFDQFAPIALGAKASVVITTNYGTGTAQEAASWVKYSNVTKGYGFKYWEVGNECYGTWEEDTHTVPNDPYTYGTQATAYITAMKAQDPTVKVGVVVETGEDSYANNQNHYAVNPVTGVKHYGWTPVVLATMKSLGVLPDFVVYHYYAQQPGTESDEALLQNYGSNWESDIPNLRLMLNDYFGTTSAANVNIIVTENNSASSSPGKQSTSLVNALYLADSFGNAIQTELKGFAWWDIYNDQETGNNNSPDLYGWREYGDSGLLSPTQEKYPTFYAMRILQYFARGGCQVVQAASNYFNLDVFAVKQPNGQVNTMVINKGLTPVTGQFSILGGPYGAWSVNSYSYGITQDNAEKTGTGSPDLVVVDLSSQNQTYTFPPYSITVMNILRPRMVLGRP
jgi:alpha-L-arabinofuranosidase